MKDAWRDPANRSPALRNQEEAAETLRSFGLSSTGNEVAQLTTVDRCGRQNPSGSSLPLNTHTHTENPKPNVFLAQFVLVCELLSKVQPCLPRLLGLQEVTWSLSGLHSLVGVQHVTQRLPQARLGLAVAEVGTGETAKLRGEHWGSTGGALGRRCAKLGQIPRAGAAEAGMVPVTVSGALSRGMEAAK